MRQDDITANSQRASMTVREVVEAWGREIGESDVRALVGVARRVIEKDPSCIEALQAVEMRAWHPWERLRYAQDWLRDVEEQSDEARLQRAARVRIDVPAFVAELRRCGIEVPRALGGWPVRPVPPSPPGTGDVSHSDDFSSVWWFGDTFTFNPVQAKVVEVLWIEWERCRGGLAKSTIISVAEDHKGRSGDPRVSDIFDRGKHPAWGRMIQKIGTGAVYGLVEPDRHSRA